MAGQTRKNFGVRFKCVSRATLGWAVMAWLPQLAIAATLSDLDFLDGHWLWDRDGQRIEEIWLPAAGKTKTAMFRWAQGDKLVTIELVIVSEEADDVHLRFKHFDAQYVPWEKEAPNHYVLQSAGDQQAIFRQVGDNPKVPEYFIYARDDNVLTFRGTNDHTVPVNDDDLVLEFFLDGAAQD